MTNEQELALAFHKHETDTSKSAFENWVARVEATLGHDLDGDQTTDGYSLDFALDAFNKGMTPSAYVKSALNAMSVPQQHAHRIARQNAKMPAPIAAVLNR
jgi:hypothetical protein